MHLIHPSRFCMCNAQVYPVKYLCNFQTLSSPYVVCFCLRGDSMRLNGSYCRTVRLCDMVSHLQLIKCQRNCTCYEVVIDMIYMYIYPVGYSFAGLIPNLLGEGVGARFNCRDAVWWWLQSVKDYCVETGSLNILSESVHRIYPTDESSPQTAADDNALSQPLHQLIHLTLTAHWKGICFRSPS